MSTFRLPDYLGGHPVELRTHVIDGPETRVDVQVIHPEAQTVVNLLFGSLIQVKPPLPPEPAADGTFVTVESEGLKVYAYSRRAAIHASMYPDLLPEYRWWWHDNGDWVTWALVCAEGDPVVQIPDPAKDAPTLPYAIKDSDGACIEVEGAPSGRTRLSVPCDSPWLLGWQIRVLGTALLRRASEVGA